MVEGYENRTNGLLEVDATGSRTPGLLGVSEAPLFWGLESHGPDLYSGASLQ